MLASSSLIRVARNTLTITLILLAYTLLIIFLERSNLVILYVTTSRES